MLGWFKRRKNQNFMENLMRAAAEGDNKAMVNRALGSISIQLPPEEDNTQYCIKTSSAIVSFIATRANDPIKSMKSADDSFVAGILSFVVSNHLSHIIGAPFETVASIVPINLFGEDYASNISDLGDAYNTMMQEGRVIEAMGKTISKWVTTPSEEHLEKLVALYKMSKEHY